MRISFFRTPGVLRTIFRNRVWRIKAANKVFLTFDDGPTETTQWVLDFLDKEDIKATFFCVGDNVLKNGNLFKRITNSGHDVGNHTMNHENSSNSNFKDYKKSVLLAEELTGSELFRPPYGRLSLGREKRLKKKVVMWSWLSHDYDPDVEVSEILRNANKNIRSGDILLFHDNEKSINRLKEILPEVVAGLKKKDMEFATISSYI